VVWAASPQVKADERLLFFPTTATWDQQHDQWRIPIHGWIFEPEKDSISRQLAVRRLRDLLGLEQDQPSSALLTERAGWFLVDNERGKRITIRIAGRTVQLDRSDADGHFLGTVVLPADVVARHASGQLLRFEAVMRSGDRRRFSGRVHLCVPAGLSVISDIDDTIKVSEVRDKKRLLQRTFLEPFAAVPGMSEMYRQRMAQGVEFHYVSASPWQLYEPLSTFMSQAQFPEGTFHLKRFRLKDSSFKNLLQDPVEYKRAVIEDLFRRYPSRQFILVGDSGEHDPEVYGLVARRYPRQVVRILIRSVVSGEQKTDSRYQDAFRDLPAERWILFEDAGQVSELLPDQPPRAGD
jgi:phosphatidate phosphatase APP1